MHRPAPESLDMDQAALVLPLMYVVQRRTGIGVTEYFDSPETAMFDKPGLLAQEAYGDKFLVS